MTSTLSTDTGRRKPEVDPIIMPGWHKHGYVSSPPSRAYWCATTQGAGCGSIASEPQSVEAPKGFPEAGPPDGQLASGGISRFGSLDRITAPDGKPWRAMKVTAGAVLRVRWWLTAPHRTSRWRLFITKDGWDPTRPLSRDQLEPEPFCHNEWTCPDNANWRCFTPINDVHHWAYLPAGKTGRHVIYAVWDVADTGNAFYSTCDVDFSAVRDDEESDK